MDIQESRWLPAIYDCLYLSDESESEFEEGSKASRGTFDLCSGYNSFSINSDTTIIKIDLNLHQILNYPSLEKHSDNQIQSMCNDIDIIWSNCLKPREFTLESRTLELRSKLILQQQFL